MIDIIIHKVHADKTIYVRSTFKPESINNIVKMEKQKNIDCDKLFQGQGKLFDINCYNIL